MSRLGAELFGDSGFIDLLRRFCPPEVSVGCSSSMTNANVSTLLLEHASRGAFLLEERSSFNHSRPRQKYCGLLVDSNSRSKGERGRDDMAITWPVVMVKLVIATLRVPWAVAALYRQCSCALFRFFMSVWCLAACSVMLASCVLSRAESARGAPPDLKRQCSCPIARSSKRVGAFLQILLCRMFPWPVVWCTVMPLLVELSLPRAGSVAAHWSTHV
jgi:hypothetical protein